jgi:hypothetical protein
MGALDAETKSSIPDVSAAKSDDARLPMLYPRDGPNCRTFKQGLVA